MIDSLTPLLADGATANDAVTTVSLWQCFFGAATGASFYILMRCYDYLTDRSFDPKYNAAYITRFVCGIVAGFILAQVSGFFIQADTNWAKIGPGVFALLGGFSAEAVEEVLKRMVDVFLALVKGSGTDSANAQLEAQKAQLTAAQSKKDADLRKALSSIPTAGLPSDTTKAIQSIVASL